MKTIIGAIALVIAAPVAAQTAPAGAQGGHAQHQQQGQMQHGQMDHSRMQHGQPGQHGCCKQVNGRMECPMMKGHGGQQGGQSQHQGHSRN